jgi:hypothetical protein
MIDAVCVCIHINQEVREGFKHASRAAGTE